MAYKEMEFTQQRATRTGDGAGGKIETFATVATLTGRKHFYQRQSQQQLERTEQPARAVETSSVVIFDDPDTDILQHDRLIDPDAATWTVKHVRHYDFQTQADVELVA